ncbi:hypothetical protein N657DRAFT_574581 [Parathielavia appendiculata]|uniref:Uncharacterized protein n=1 Tax=Parathielavia appendiculata TaxID=2587402 RepID=A0AAN6TYA3_9PEZI|nr:hypothetical protein N657DRAFT_574581 [Parathielavia appendiculata]
MHGGVLLSLLLANTGSLALSTPPIERRGFVIDRPAVKPPFSEAAQNKDLDEDLSPVPWIEKAWDPDWLPQACVIEANFTGFDPSEFEAVEVMYEDCAASWTVCRHRQADESWFYILETFSKVPVGLRQYISNAVVVPRPEHSASEPQMELPSAYARPEVGVITFMPSCECGDHAIFLGFSLTPHQTSNSASSSTKQPVSVLHLYHQAVSSDKSVTTTYARTSWEEAFADAVRWALSHMTHKDGLRAYSRGWEECRGQVEVVGGLLKGVIWPAGGKCVGRVRSSWTRAVRVSDGGHDADDGEDGRRERGRGRGGPAGLEGVPEIGFKGEVRVDLVV